LFVFKPCWYCMLSAYFTEFKSKIKKDLGKPTVRMTADASTDYVIHQILNLLHLSMNSAASRCYGQPIFDIFEQNHCWCVSWSHKLHKQKHIHYRNNENRLCRFSYRIMWNRRERIWHMIFRKNFSTVLYSESSKVVVGKVWVSARFWTVNHFLLGLATLLSVVWYVRASWAICVG